MSETLSQPVAMPYQDISRPSLMKTQQSLSRIFAICDQVAETNQPIRTESQGKEAARAFFGAPTNKLDTISPKLVKLGNPGNI